MKKSILSIAILSLIFACNDTNTPPAEPMLNPVADSTTKEKDSVSDKAAVSSMMGIGLTQEEMRDDSVFSDGSKPTSWEIAGFTDVKGFKLFLKQVQIFVMNNDKEQLAKIIKYPFRRSIKNEADFIKNYDNIFTKDVKLSIARINFSQIFRNNKGAMSEDGKVWFLQEDNTFKIVVVNN